MPGPNRSGAMTFNVKATPKEVDGLREKYPAVMEGYHMNKKFWITVVLDGSIPDEVLKGFIDISYKLVT